MKRSELYEIVQKMIEADLQVKISKAKSKRIVKFIEQNYHNQLFNPTRKESE